MHKPTALFILTPGFPENESDSTCLPAQQNLIKSINKIYPGVKVIVFSFQYPFVKFEYTWQGNTVYAFGGQNRNGITRRVLWLKIMQQLNKLHQYYTVKGVLSFWCDECAYVASRFCRKFNYRHLCWLLGQDVRAGNRYVSKIHEPGKTFVALSDFASGMFKSNYNIQPIATVPPGINTCDFEENNTTRDIDLLAAGSLIPLKQFDIFIQIAAALKIKSPGITIVLSGDGPELQKLKSIAFEKGLAANIHFKGSLPHTALLQLMQRSKIFLHPSSFEGFGMVCAEALYAGAQVISFCKPMNRVIKNWHIAENTVDMQQKAMELLLNLPASEKILIQSADDSANTIMKLFCN